MNAPQRLGPDVEPDPSIPLPPYELRMGGKHFKKDHAFVNAGVRDARVLRQRAGLGRRKRVLDWGCGAGRLAVGIKHLMGDVEDYHGVDVQPTLVAWAQEHLADDRFRFTLVDAHNARYNPDGRPSYDIPGEDGSVDVLHGYSVLSHMTASDVAGYARTIARLLAPDGRAALTAFVEEEVPDCVENPEGYLPIPLKGELHCVRYERHFFEATMWDAGLAVSDFAHGRETDGQSMYVLRRR
ncbi:class I SAM-dependent methyltransferase [Nocardioides litoris]|uniref:class I SAM-dependent methyltransferase n=1 Tax=Nocardioides litoris TaxID=1926648 RepID=UPI0011204FA2|nr:class I SAM-dependent methyltransferase [Nocardioides litoris]